MKPYIETTDLNVFCDNFDIVEFLAGNYKVAKAPGFSNDWENME